MLYCPTCSKLFHDDGDVCPYDGDKLIVPPDERLGEQVGSYMLLKVIGKGGMGKVYKAEHVFIGKSFAVKILHPRFMEHTEVVDRFIFEARAAARIHHPNIVDITDFGYTAEGLPFFVMEYMEGRELIELIMDESPLPMYRAVNIMVQAADALMACHEEGIVHQDLKPENLFLVKRAGRRKLVHLVNDPHNPIKTEYEESYDMVKVLDFGVAHLAKLAEADTIAGTPEYMAPEQARGITGDPRSDIYSLGVIFYEILTNDLPYTGRTATEVFQKVFNEPVPSLRQRYPKLDIPLEVDRLMTKALAKDPNDRYQDLEEFISDLNCCFGKVFYSRDIPTVLAQNKDVNIDPSLAADLGKLFSSNKKRPSSLQSQKRIPSLEKSQKVTALRRKESKAVRTREYGEVEQTPEPQKTPETPIDPNLKRDLNSLFSKKKK
mgnify:CR=1 FL=1